MTGLSRRSFAQFIIGALILLAASCAAGDQSAENRGATNSQLEFWSHMQSHCGNAYSGGLTLAPLDDDMLTGTEELIVHFRECSELEMRIPFHMELEDENDWDRSRTWVLTRTARGMELRHDHRRRDGTDDDLTWYGGPSMGEGGPDHQYFISEQQSTDHGVFIGWRLEIAPGERYTYGTVQGNDWTWRIDFDLLEPVEAPPPPWDYE